MQMNKRIAFYQLVSNNFQILSFNSKSKLELLFKKNRICKKIKYLIKKKTQIKSE
jgi:hypothetical protein